MFPPIVRRMFSSSPIVAPLLLVLAITTLALGLHPRTRQYAVPSTWVGGSGVGGPVGVGKVDKIYDQHPAKDPTPVAAPPSQEEDDDLRLPAEYNAYFKSGRMPDALDAVPQLAARLAAFLRKPALSHAAAWEANIKNCPPSQADSLVNKDQYEGNHDFWVENVTPKEIIRRRADLVKYIAARVWEGEEVIGRPGTRGIVYTAGNQDTIDRVILAIRILKEYNVQLPIEIVHYHDELTNYDQREALKKAGVKLVEVRRVNKIADAWKNWQIKAFAIIQSSFSEVLYMDSDNIPLRDPTTLFDAPHYLNNGQAAFWPDINKDHPSNAIWRIIDEPCSLDEWTFESGQIVINKAGNSGLNLAALHLAAGMLDDHNRDFWLRISGGDKDTFRWGFRILDIPYAASPQFLTAVGFLESNNAFCGHTSLQHDLTPTPGTNTYAPLFVHSNLLKHMGGWGFGSSGSNIYSYAKHMAVNAAGEPSLNTYPTITRDGGIRGLCLDVKGDSKETAADGENYVVLERLDDMPGHPFQGFVDRWFAAGGHPGGW